MLAPSDGSDRERDGAASLCALHELLRTVVAYQNQRLGTNRATRSERDRLVEELHWTTVRLAREIAGDSYAELIDNYGSRGRGLIHHAVHAAETLGTVRTLELIPSTDPRAIT